MTINQYFFIQKSIVDGCGLHSTTPSCVRHQKMFDWSQIRAVCKPYPTVPAPLKIVPAPCDDSWRPSDWGREE